MMNIALKTIMANNYADENQKRLYKKFPSTHFLSNPQNVQNTFLWSTFFRRNLHRLAIDYLKINLHLYQAMMLYLMGICQFIVVIASRAAAKSFIIALFACCRCITRPYTQIVLSSATKGQSKLIVAVKIKQELMRLSPVLRQEIANIKDNQNEIIVFFKNGSTITVVPASENGRGYKSTCCIREEFRMINKNVDDSVLSPFQMIRQAPYMLSELYASNKDLQEEPVDIYISSSWYDDGHWMWPVAEQAHRDMINGKKSCLLAFDESITLKHNIKTMQQLKREKKKQDPLTWRIEFLNERVKQNAGAFFSYDILTKNQNLKQPFYPRIPSDYKENKKNPYYIPKQTGEIRVVSCDFAFIDKSGNDNSVFSCIRALPEFVTHYDDENNSKAIVKQGYRRMIPYLEAQPGGDISKQAVRVRELFEDFAADYIVLDLRNGGVGVYHLLAKTLYDDQRNKEYEPLTAMNNDDLARAIKIPGAKPIIYTISATQKLNSDIALDFRLQLVDSNINLLINYSEAKDEIFTNMKGYKDSSDSEEQLFFEMPFIQTQLLLHESSNLLYEKNKQTGAITVYEQGTNTKDRYSSVSMGSFFISELEKDLFNKSLEESNYSKAPTCISAITF